MKKTILMSAILAAVCAGASAQVSGQTEISGDLEFIPGEISPDGVPHAEIALWDGNDEPSANNNTINVYDENMNLVKSIAVKMEEFEEGETYKIYNEASGQWEIKDENYSTKTYGPENIGLEPYDGVYTYLTQRVFNDDDAYEYIMPLRETVITEGESYSRKEARITGFSIMSENGNTLQTVNFSDDDNYQYCDFSLYKLGNNVYLVAEADYDKHYLYRVTPTSTGVNSLKAVMTVNVKPRVADRGESFTVDLGKGDNAARTVTVTNAAGQTVWRQDVPAGQTQVTISAARMGRGVNVVNVSSGKQRESCKVIVK